MLVAAVSGVCTLSAGKLRHRVSVLKDTPTSNERYGGMSSSWSVLDTVWAEFSYQGGREFLTSDQVANETKAVVRMRYRSDFGVDNRVSFEGLEYEVVSKSNPDGRKRFLVLMLRRVD